MTDAAQLQVDRFLTDAFGRIDVGFKLQNFPRSAPW